MSEKSAPLVEFRKVGLVFGKTVVHRDLSFKINAGESITILGPSGAGKTQILKMIIGLTRPTSGEVLIGGKDVTRRPATDHSATHRTNGNLAGQ